jgi:uncharacterized integral membrane protein
MRGTWIIILVYLLISLLFFGLNMDYVVAKYDTNLLVGHFWIPLLPALLVLSLIFLLLVAVIDTVSIDNLRKEVERLKAQLLDSQTEEIKNLRAQLEVNWGEFQDEIMKKLEEFEKLLRGE